MHKIALVILPGLHGTDKLFRGVLNQLPPFIRPVVLSYPPDKKLGYSDLVPVVLAAVKKNSPPGQPFVLLGESFGGPLSLLVADQQLSLIHI